MPLRHRQCYTKMSLAESFLISRVNRRYVQVCQFVHYHTSFCLRGAKEVHHVFLRAHPVLLVAIIAQLEENSLTRQCRRLDWEFTLVYARRVLFWYESCKTWMPRWILFVRRFITHTTCLTFRDNHSRLFSTVRSFIWLGFQVWWTILTTVDSQNFLCSLFILQTSICGEELEVVGERGQNF